MKRTVLLYSLLTLLCMIGCKNASNPKAPDVFNDVEDEGQEHIEYPQHEDEVQEKAEYPQHEDEVDKSIQRDSIVDDGQRHWSKSSQLYQLTPFPIPYPRPSSIDVLPSNIINACNTLGEVDNILSQALEKCQYYRKSYFFVPEGFALVTQLEQINVDGSSKLERERWLYDDYARPIVSIPDYVSRLFKAQPGYYRSIVFLVSNNSFTSSKEPLTRSKVYDWLDEGGLKLPGYVRKKSIDSEYSIIALIYEFRKFKNSKEAEFLYPSELQGRIHMVKSNILSYLN